ncbi:hypothetical protein BH24CHL1_BH24CHL1_03760 [soil metagenome]
MKSPKWRVYLEEMLNGCQDVQLFTNGKTLEDLIQDKGFNYSVLHALQLIGEAARNVPDDIQEQMPDVDWRGIAGVRNVTVHGYASINNTTIWDIVQHQVPDSNTSSKLSSAQLDMPTPRSIVNSTAASVRDGDQGTAGLWVSWSNTRQT